MNGEVSRPPATSSPDVVIDVSRPEEETPSQLTPSSPPPVEHVQPMGVAAAAHYSAPMSLAVQPLHPPAPYPVNYAQQLQQPGYQPQSLHAPCPMAPPAYYPKTDSPYPTSPTVYQEPPPPYYPPQPQQQQAVVMTTPVIVQQSVPYESFCGHISLACFVFWCCGGLLGLIAFILAVVAESTKSTNRLSARQLGRASLGLSIAGIVVGVVLFIAVGVALGITQQSYSTSCYGYYSSYYRYYYSC